MLTPGRLDVGLVGTAREIPVIGLALAGSGHIPWFMTEPRPEARETSLAQLRGVTIRPADEVVHGSDLVVIAPGEGETVASLVADIADGWKAGQIVFHTDPALGVDVLEPARAAGAITLAIHPVLHFTGTSLDVQRLKDAYFAVTAPVTVMPIAQALVVEMGGEPFIVDEADRPAYAEVVDTVSTFSRAIIDQSTFRLTEIGVARPGEVLRALAHSAVDESLRRSADGAVDPVESWLDDTTEDDD